MLNGILNVYKEKRLYFPRCSGKTAWNRRAEKKIGHTGTLDPQAEGVLPVCLGKATKVCDLLTDKDKVYEAVLLLGQTTDTQDTTGTVLEQSAVTCSEEEVKKSHYGICRSIRTDTTDVFCIKGQRKKNCATLQEMGSR